MNYSPQYTINEKIKNNLQDIEKLKNSLNEIEEEDTKEMVTNLIPKIKNYSLDDLKNVENIFE